MNDDSCVICCTNPANRRMIVFPVDGVMRVRILKCVCERKTKHFLLNLKKNNPFKCFDIADCTAATHLYTSVTGNIARYFIKFFFKIFINYILVQYICTSVLYASVINCNLYLSLEGICRVKVKNLSYNLIYTF